LFAKNSLSDFSKIGSYLAGLIEGDGYITINKKPYIGITFNLKDQPLAEYLLSLFDKGHIVKRKTNSVELRITSIRSLVKLINLINGKMRTPKIYDLNRLIDHINNNHTTYTLKKYSLDTTSLNNNNWLAGFIDADGGFYIRLAPKQIACKFSLEQRMYYNKTNESYYNILNDIALFLDTKLCIRKRILIKKNYFIIRVENQKTTKNLINYLDKNKLLSSKYLDYLIWKEVFHLIVNKKHMTIENKEYIHHLKNSMNNKRVFFTWNHLKTF
jgi:hypothetical protein